MKIRVHRIPDIDVKAVRDKTGLTQLEFAAKFAISPGTLRHWERGDRRPRGTSRVLLHIIDREPTTSCASSRGMDETRVGLDFPRENAGSGSFAPCPAIATTTGKCKP